jgi:hypothetical protein
LSLATTVSNHTDQPISLIFACALDPVVVSLALQGTGEPATQLTSSPNCPLPSLTPSDLKPPVGAGSAHTYTLRLPIYNWRSDWVGGVYTLTATITRWHQPGDSGLSGTATGQTTITLR